MRRLMYPCTHACTGLPQDACSPVQVVASMQALQCPLPMLLHSACEGQTPRAFAASCASALLGGAGAAALSCRQLPAACPPCAPARLAGTVGGAEVAGAAHVGWEGGVAAVAAQGNREASHCGGVRYAEGSLHMHTNSACSSGPANCTAHQLPAGFSKPGRLQAGAWACKRLSACPCMRCVQCFYHRHCCRPCV